MKKNYHGLLEAEDGSKLHFNLEVDFSHPTHPVASAIVKLAAKAKKRKPEAREVDSRLV